MRIPGRRTLLRGTGWAQAMIRPGPAILGYHRVADSGWDPQHLRVSRDNFAQQLDVLKNEALCVPLEDLAHRLAAKRLPRRTVAITFDDGYADTFKSAAPMLEQRDLPATVFVITGSLGKTFWWTELEDLVAAAAELPTTFNLAIDGRSMRWAARGSGRSDRESLIRALGDFFRALPASVHEYALGELRERLAAAPVTHDSSRALSAAELASLAGSGQVEIGSHTVTHQSLGLLDPASQLEELKRSKETLEHISGRPVRSFSYPNGITSPGIPPLAEELGYAAGCTSREAVVSSRCDPYLLPRLWVGDWDGDRFARWLRRWLR